MVERIDAEQTSTVDDVTSGWGAEGDVACERLVARRGRWRVPWLARGAVECCEECEGGQLGSGKGIT